MPLELITDRTEQDVQRWEYLKSKNLENMTTSERNEWAEGLKGSYGATDLNRVGEATDYIADQIRDSGYIVTLKPVKTDWTIQDKPTPQQLDDYLDNISILKEILSGFPGIPNVPPDIKELTYEQANEIEQILFDIELMITKMREGVWHSNAFMFYSGQDPLPSNLSQYLMRSSQQKIIRTNDNKVFIVR